MILIMMQTICTKKMKLIKIKIFIKKKKLKKNQIKIKKKNKIND